MSSDPTARVFDITSIERFKGGLAQFGESIKTGLLEADSEIARTMGWLERDRIMHWRRQIQVRREEVATAKSALFRKQLQGSAQDGRPSIVDEKIALERAKSRLGTAEERHTACKRWRNRLEQEYSVYKGHVQTLSFAADRGVPDALALLERMLLHLDAYIRGESGAQDQINLLLEEDEQHSMKRGGTEELDTTESTNTSDEVEP